MKVVRTDDIGFLSFHLSFYGRCLQEEQTPARVSVDAVPVDEEKREDIHVHLEIVDQKRRQTLTGADGQHVENKQMQKLQKSIPFNGCLAAGQYVFFCHTCPPQLHAPQAGTSNVLYIEYIVTIVVM